MSNEKGTVQFGEGNPSRVTLASWVQSMSWIECPRSDRRASDDKASDIPSVFILHIEEARSTPLAKRGAPVRDLLAF